MLYGIMKIGYGLVGVGVTPELAARDARFADIPPVAPEVSPGYLGRYVVVSHDESFAEIIEKKRGGYYELADQVAADRYASKVRWLGVKEREAARRIRARIALTGETDGVR